MDVEEGLVESVSEGRPRLDTDEGKSGSAYHSPAIGTLVTQAVADSGPPSTMHCVVHPGDCVRNGLGNGDACRPSVEEVEVIVRDLEKRDEGVVTERKENCWDKIERGKGASAAAQGCNGLLVVEDIVWKRYAPRNIEQDIDAQHNGVPSAW